MSRQPGRKPALRWVTWPTWRPSQNFLLNSDPLVIGYAIVDLAVLSTGERLTDYLATISTTRRGRRTEKLAFRDLLAARIALAILGDPVTNRGVAEMLGTSSLPKHLGAGPFRPWPNKAGNHKTLRDRRAAEQAAQRAWDYLVGRHDSFIGPRGRRLTIPQILDLVLDARRITVDHLRQEDRLPPGVTPDSTDDEVLAAWQAEVDGLRRDIAASLVEASLALVPQRILKQLGEAVAVDGTFVGAYVHGYEKHWSLEQILDEVHDAAVRVRAEYGFAPAEGKEGLAAQVDVLRQHQRRRKEGTLPTKRRTNYKKEFRNPLDITNRMSRDLEANWYVRQDSEVKGFGFECSLATAIGRVAAGQVVTPSLILGAIVDVPGRRLGPHALTLMARIRRWADLQRLMMWIFVGDRLYPGLDVALRRGLRLLGWMPVWRLTPSILDSVLTKKLEHQGLVHGGDGWYCAQIEDSVLSYPLGALAEKPEDRPDPSINETRLAMRAKPTHGVMPLDQAGEPQPVRLACPALSVGGAKPTASCARRPHTWGQAPHIVIDLDDEADADREKPPICTVAYDISVPWMTDAVAGSQAYPLHSSESDATHGLLRAVNEGKFGALKSQAYTTVQTYDWVRDRGVAAHDLAMACVGAGANIAAVISFLRNSVPDLALGRVRQYGNSRPQPTDDAADDTTYVAVRTAAGTKRIPLDRPAA